ncbi:MAG: von Willebrand factor type A domain-containing protein [Chloroflexota bacterium]|jgi:Ca-activated chloride channel family protein
MKTKLVFSMISAILVLAFAMLACENSGVSPTATKIINKPNATKTLSSSNSNVTVTQEKKPSQQSTEDEITSQKDSSPTQTDQVVQPTSSAMLEAEAPAEAAKGSAGAIAPLPVAPSYAPMPTLAPPNGQPYADNFFKNYGVNPFIDTEDDHLSTFALDVDTGSYTVARRFINDGNMPPQDSVRVEEFVNYFEQGYELPKHGETFAIHMDGGPTPFTESDKYYMLRIGLQGYAVSDDERKDVSLVFVIDVSGSMEMENRLELVKKALKLLVKQLRSTDTVGIVVYGTEARIVLPPVEAGQKETILEAINALEPEGSTNAEAGLQLGYSMALKAFKPEGINRVILCSDGVANVGETDAADIWKTIKARASEGITLTTIGFGMGNYNDVLMEQLADKGNGFYAYVDTITEAKRIFVQNLTSTLQTIAMNAKIQVDFNPEVVSRYRLVGFENRAVADQDFRNDKVDAGEIGAGHSVTALYEVKLQPEAKGRIATIHLRWEDPDTHKVTETKHDFYDEELSSTFTKASPYFQWDILVAEFAEVIRDSYWAQNSNLAGILEDVERVSRKMPEDDNDVSEFVDLVRQANQISRDN